MTSALRKSKAKLIAGILPCPGLRDGIFTDCRGRAYDLSKQKRLRPKEAAVDPRLQRSPRMVLKLIAEGKLYPVVRTNARNIEIFECALADHWARLSLTPVVSRKFLQTV